MQWSMERALRTYELLEHIILQLDSIRDMTRAQLVCRRWRDIVQDSLAIREARWYCPPDKWDIDLEEEQHPAPFRLNPVFESLGVSVGRGGSRCLPSGLRECGKFDLTKRIYDKPGSWTTMVATQPPCRRMHIDCHDDYTSDADMYYGIEATTGYLLVGDVMAVLAECQNRQHWGEDRWAGAMHIAGQVFPVHAGEVDEDLAPILQAMNDDVTIKVAVGQAWDAGDFPAFSLRRVRPTAGQNLHDPASYMDFLHELVVHKMIWDGVEYEWDRADKIAGEPKWCACKEGEYKANLLAVRSHEGKYLAKCGNIFRLLSDA